MELSNKRLYKLCFFCLFSKKSKKNQKNRSSCLEHTHTPRRSGGSKQHYFFGWSCTFPSFNNHDTKATAGTKPFSPRGETRTTRLSQGETLEQDMSHQVSKGRKAPKTLMHGLASVSFDMFTQRVIIQTLSTFAADSQWIWRAVRVLRTADGLFPSSDRNHRHPQRKSAAVVIVETTCQTRVADATMFRVHFGSTFDLWFLIDSPTPPCHHGRFPLFEKYFWKNPPKNNFFGVFIFFFSSIDLDHIWQSCTPLPPHCTRSQSVSSPLFPLFCHLCILVTTVVV